MELVVITLTSPQHLLMLITHLHLAVIKLQPIAAGIQIVGLYFALWLGRTQVRLKMQIFVRHHSSLIKGTN